MRPPATRIALWSGPRSLSTAMMRAFEARGDTAVIDEPFYAAYLARTGSDHPLREAILASQPTDPARVVDDLEALAPDGMAIVFEKQMVHHMAPDADLAWMARRRNAFLIRSPERVLASYARRRESLRTEDVGFLRAAELFDREADRLGAAPPVIEAEDVLADPAGRLAALCRALGLRFRDAMLSWPPGRRDSDGVWAPAWYGAVERSTGFASPEAADPTPLSASLRALAEASRPHFERLARYKLA